MVKSMPRYFSRYFRGQLRVMLRTMDLPSHGALHICPLKFSSLMPQKEIVRLTHCKPMFSTPSQPISSLLAVSLFFAYPALEVKVGSQHTSTLNRLGSGMHLQRTYLVFVLGLWTARHGKCSCRMQLTPDSCTTSINPVLVELSSHKERKPRISIKSTKPCSKPPHP